MQDDAPIIAAATPSRRRRLIRTLAGLLAALSLYFVVAYVVLPAIWKRFEARYPELADAPWITHTAAGIPGDPINIGIVGSEQELHLAIRSAKWYPADPITLESSLRIAGDVLLHRSYDDAPVSNLYLFGRKQDVAFEQPVGDDPSSRHHVRFWKSEARDANGAPLWLGSATLDKRVGLSRDTGQITHHISPDVDAERDKIIADLSRANVVASVRSVDNFHRELSGRNGEGDPWRTDGRLGIVVLARTANTP